ncbi:MAG: SDR family oxidoreductase [Dehalococcoidia bacterium]
MTLEGKVAVITGASRGIGRALAVGFAQEGAVVVAAARTQRPTSGSPEGSLEETVQRIMEAGGKAIAMSCDVASEGDVKALVERTLSQVGPIDVLVNNAGVLLSGPITDFDAAQWDTVMAVNLRGPFLMCKYVLPGMMERRQGSVINISSRSAIWEEAESLAYGPSKAALDRFTLNLAADVKSHNIAVNALGPGLVASEMTRDINPSNDKWGRWPAPPEEIVPSAVWLAQQDASTFTGRVVHRDEFGETWP